MLLGTRRVGMAVKGGRLGRAAAETWGLGSAVLCCLLGEMRYRILLKANFCRMLSGQAATGQRLGCLAARTLRCWHRLPSDVVEALCLETFKVSLEVSLCSLL